MNIQFQNFISPINLKPPKSRVLSFGALKNDTFEKQSDTKMPSFEFCLDLFKRALLVTNSDIAKDKLSEVYAPLSFSPKEQARFESIITRPDYIEELNKINNEKLRPTTRQQKEVMLLSTIYAAKADDKVYSKMEPYLNSDKLNLPKYMTTIYKMSKGEYYSGEFERFQELMEDENIINLINEGFMESDYLRIMSINMRKDSSYVVQNALKNEAVREIYKSGHLESLHLEEDKIKRIELVMQSPNARKLVLNGNIEINYLLSQLGDEGLERAIRLMDKDNYANILKKLTSNQNGAYHNLPDNALNIIWGDGNPNWYYDNNPDKMPTDEEFQKNFDRMLRFLENKNLEVITSNFDITFPEIFDMRYMGEEGLEEQAKLHSIVLEKKNNVLAHPELYIEGEGTEEENIESINLFFSGQRKNLVQFLKYSDSETLEALLRLRLDSAQDELDEFEKFSLEEELLYKEMVNCVDTKGKPFPPSIKLQFLGLIKAYKESGLSIDTISEMAATGVIDFYELNLNLFKHVIKNLGIDEEKLSAIPEDKIMMWDMRYIHNLAEELNFDTYDKLSFEDVIKASLFGDFKEYINDDTNGIGAANEQTKAIFEENGMDYSKWINPSKNLNVQFKATDKNSDKLLQISKQVKEDIDALRKTPLKGVIDKRFKKEIIKNEFRIPNKCLNNKNEMETFVKNIIEQLNDVWKRAKENLNNPNKAQQAKNTLTILDHLNQRLSDIKSVTEEKIEKPIDLTIKMWDRNPPHDLFQGNYSTCCIGMGRGNGNAVPCYLLNNSFNMIEIIDNKTNSTIGNALCYFANVDNKPSFIIDNIEINNSKKPSDKTGLKLRDAIVQYASNIAKDVTGKDDTPIYMGTSYNDVPTKNLEKENHVFDFIGFLGGLIDVDESVYMDLCGGWVEEDERNQKQPAFRLK